MDWQELEDALGTRDLEGEFKAKRETRLENSLSAISTRIDRLERSLEEIGTGIKTLENSISPLV